MKLGGREPGKKRRRRKPISDAEQIQRAWTHASVAREVAVSRGRRIERRVVHLAYHKKACKYTFECTTKKEKNKNNNLELNRE